MTSDWEVTYSYSIFWSQIPHSLLLPSPHSVLTFPFDLSYLTPQALQGGQENPMCQNKLYFQKPQVEPMYHNLCLCAIPPRPGEQRCNARNAGTRRAQPACRRAVLNVCYAMSLIL